ncbi:MAG: hypothetical protein DRP71_16575 [Verrucomicrobia bacterium]|nr:MAG: hypothetical protein DRP71_16575 [Verrucomicrobiota bacterium]
MVCFWGLVVFLLLPNAGAAGGLVWVSGETEWFGLGSAESRSPIAGQALPASGRIRSVHGVTVLRSDPSSIVLIDEGGVLEWNDGADGLVLEPKDGLVLLQTNRTNPESDGLAIAFGQRRFWIATGTVVLEKGEDELHVGVLLRGREFGPVGSILLSEAPAVTLEAGGIAVIFDRVSDLVRNDQVRIYQGAVRGTEMLTDQLQAECDGVSSADLGAVLESLRQLRFHLNAEKRAAIMEVLVTTARREWSLRQSQPFELPALLAIPEPVAPWDDALRKWLGDESDDGREED